MSAGVAFTRAFLTGGMVAGRGARVRRRVRLSGSPGSDAVREYSGVTALQSAAV